MVMLLKVGSRRLQQLLSKPAGTVDYEPMAMLKKAAVLCHLGDVHLFSHGRADDHR